MASTTKNLYIGEGLNQLFNIAENIDLISATYDKYIDTGRFFIQKREGINQILTADDDILDFGVYKDSLKTEKLVLFEDDLSVFTDTVISSVATGFGTNSSMIKTTGVGGTYQDGGTATGGTADTLTDTGASWTVNEYAGFYIWISDGTNAGQIRIILSNTSDTITVGGWSGGVSCDNTSVYKIYSLLSNTVLISDRTNQKMWMYDGNTKQEVKNLNLFNLGIYYSNCLWTVPTSNPNIIWYSEEGNYLNNEGFIDTGADEIIDVFVLGDFLLVFKATSIFAISKYTDSDGAILFNISEVVSNVGIYNKGAVGMYLAQCYFIGSDKQIQNIQISSDGIKLVGNLTVVGKALKNYLNLLPANEPTSFVLGDNYFEFIVGSKGFKYWDYLKSWTFNTYGVSFSNVKSVLGEYYYTDGNKIGKRGGDDKQDFGSDYFQRFGFMVGLDNIFSIKRLEHITFLFGYTEGLEVGCSLFVQSNTSIRQGLLGSSINEGAKSSGIVDFNLLGQSQLGDILLGGEKIENIKTASSLLNFKKIINRTAFFFQVILESNTEYGFDLGEILLTYYVHTSQIHPATTTN